MKTRNIKLFESYRNSYQRVVPRDFFNEGKLLKCMGILALAILDNTVPKNINIEIDENGNSFEIILDEMWNILYVANYPITINGNGYLIGTNYNSKDPLPFVVVYEDYEIEIFDSTGSFSEEFIEVFSSEDED